MQRKLQYHLKLSKWTKQNIKKCGENRRNNERRKRGAEEKLGQVKN